MLKLIDPVAQAKALRRALRAHRRAIFLCEECGYPWMAPTRREPSKCANMNCRVGAYSHKQARRGRPANTSHL